MRQLMISANYNLDDLHLAEKEEPPMPGPGQVLVRMSAVSLNFRDIMVATGHDRWRPPVGRVPGSDGVGRVLAVGQGVTRFDVGDSVLTTILPNWIRGPLTEAKRNGGLGGPAADGILAELVLLSAEGLVRAPRHLDDVHAATLPTAGLTAWHALTRAGALRSDATILVEGTGGVSLFALQLAVAAGARVIATSGSNAKFDKLRTMGASSVINYRDTPDWADAVLALTDQKGVDLSIDIGGASSLDNSIRATAMNGTVSIVGLVDGLDATINLAEIFQKNLRLDGIETGSRSMLEAMIEWIEKRGVVPTVDRVFPLEDSAAAFKYLQSGAHMGKVCITL
ncbi:zinc-dependent alcohol dehydrogenase family protein [Aquisediminimonas profunda]|uniref:zinc-dependent alcohol dehydrogenase family protein n=1 Tax=Aquisediminimonas profunda TaxID=1550733 RepID=UPI001C630854|nr:NAD(P)-dependent alcohol dehydrogenase [Aquisediminimonas profunda]